MKKLLTMVLLGLFLSVFISCEKEEPDIDDFLNNGMNRISTTDSFNEGEGTNNFAQDGSLIELKGLEVPVGKTTISD